MYTNKLRLRFPVSLINMPAMAASTAGILRIDQNHRNANNLGFVLNKTPKLIKRPFFKSFTLCFSNSLPAVKTLQIFKGNRTTGIFSKLNNLLRNYMVGVTFKTCLSARDFLEMSFGRLTTTTLKFGFNCGSFLSNNINLFSRKHIAVAIGSNVNNTHINTKRSLWVNGCSVRKLYNKTKKKISFVVNQIGLTTNFSLFQFGIFTKNDRAFVSTVKTENRNGIKSIKGKNLLIVKKRKMYFKPVQGFLFGAIGFRNFANSSNGQLCGKFEFL